MATQPNKAKIIDSPAKIEQEVAKICKGVDKKTDAMMLMSPNYNWDQFLTPAPMAIAILGDLILISGYKDFKLTDNPPTGGFQHIKFPNSFRASLVQVSNAGWDAFNEAHTNMHQIQLSTGNVDTYVKRAAACLFKSSDYVIEQMLPSNLNNIVVIADTSLQLAEKIEDKFVNVMQLTGELLAACTAAKGRYEQKNSETERAIQVAQTQADMRKKQTEVQKRRLEKMEKEVERAHADFRNAMDNAPSTLDIIGLSIGDSLLANIGSITSVATTLASLITGPVGVVGVGIAAVTKQATTTQSGAVVDTSNSIADDEDSNFDSQMAEYHVYLHVGSLTKNIEALESICTGGTNGKPNLDLVNKGGAELLKQNIEATIKNIEEEIECDTKTKVLDICERSIKVCIELQKMVGLTPAKEADVNATLKKVKLLSTDCHKINARASNKIGKNPLDCKSPAMLKQQPTGKSQGLLKNAVEASRIKTEMAKATLIDARNRQDKSTEDMTANNEKLLEVLKEMAGLELDKIDFEAIAATLVKGINALAQVREQWSKLVQFFQMLSNLIKCCLHVSLNDFVDTVKNVRKIQTSTGSIPLSSFLKDTIFEQASKASQVSYVVNKVSETYVEISNNYLMDRITSLGRLIALDPKTQQIQIRRARDNLYKECEESQNAIRDKVVEQKKEFLNTISDRLESIRQLEESMPAIEETKLTEIQQTVAEGFEYEVLDDLV